jgi:hypothetical protein
MTAPITTAMLRQSGRSTKQHVQGGVTDMSDMHERVERERVRKRAKRRGFELFRLKGDGVHAYALQQRVGGKAYMRFQDLAEVMDELRARRDEIVNA